MIIISQKQLAEVVSGIDIISFANKISYLQALGLSYIGGIFLKNDILKFIGKGYGPSTPKRTRACTKA
jgi:hypothetical protein